ncbi:MAG: glycosyltransferase family 39 protein [Nitrospirae bacterium]|nr:glycosyltransferase family 39 protein [Nitrospirota bacterium]
MSKGSNRYLLTGLIILSSLLFFYKLGSYTLFDVDEAVFSEAGREMLETGNWLTPQYNYINRYDKPALFYWLMASSYLVSGINEFAARFWSALMGVFLIAATFIFARRINGDSYGLLSGLILATSIEIIVLAHSAITDMTLTFFIASGLYLFFIAMEEKDKRLYLLSYSAMGLAVLTKGPIGLVIPAMTIIPYLLLTKKFRDTLRDARPFFGVIIFLAIALPWYILEIRANGWEYINAFFFKHNINRFTSVNSGHSGSILFYIPVILTGFFPWSPFLPYAVYKTAPRGLAEMDTKARLALFSIIWFLTVLIFFSLSQTKLPNYIASLFPPMALVVAMLLKDFLEDNPPFPPLLKGGEGGLSKGVRYSAIFFALSCLILAAIFGLAPMILNRIHPILPDGFSEMPITIGRWHIVISILFFISGITSVIAFFKNKKGVAIGIVGLTISIFILITLNLAMPAVDRLVQHPLKEVALFIREMGEKDKRIATYGINNPSILFYSRQKAFILNRGEKERLNAMANEETPLYVITKLPYAREVKEATGMRYAGQRGIYILLTNNPAQCDLDKKDGR